MIAGISFESHSETKETSETTAIKKTKEIKETVLGMNVTGNKEAPNLLYIIPWKDNSNDDLAPEINRLMDEVYSTVDPDVFEKEVGFYDILTQSEKTEKTEQN